MAKTRAGYLSIEQCLAMVPGLHNSYFRMQVLRNKKGGKPAVESIKELIPGTQIQKVWVKEESFKAWLKATGRMGSDNKVVRKVKLDQDEYEAFQEWKASKAK